MLYTGSDVRGNTIKVELAGKPEPPVGGWYGGGGSGGGGRRGGGGRSGGGDRYGGGVVVEVEGVDTVDTEGMEGEVVAIVTFETARIGARVRTDLCRESSRCL